MNKYIISCQYNRRYIQANFKDAIRFPCAHTSPHSLSEVPSSLLAEPRILTL